MMKKVSGGHEAPWMEPEKFRRFELDFYKEETKQRQKEGEDKC